MEGRPSQVSLRNFLLPRRTRWLPVHTAVAPRSAVTAERLSQAKSTTTCKGLAHQLGRPPRGLEEMETFLAHTDSVLQRENKRAWAPSHRGIRDGVWSNLCRHVPQQTLLHPATSCSTSERPLKPVHSAAACEPPRPPAPPGGVSVRSVLHWRCQVGTPPG